MFVRLSVWPHACSRQPSNWPEPNLEGTVFLDQGLRCLILSLDAPSCLVTSTTDFIAAVLMFSVSAYAFLFFDLPSLFFCFPTNLRKFRASNNSVKYIIGLHDCGGWSHRITLFCKCQSNTDNIVVEKRNTSDGWYTSDGCRGRRYPNHWWCRGCRCWTLHLQGV